MLFPDVVMVLASEIAVDVVKHAFITKFNDISADVSSLLIAAGEVCSKGQISFSVKVKHVWSETWLLFSKSNPTRRNLNLF